LSSTFPILNCASKTTELLIFIDCREYVLEQLEDIHLLETYLRLNRKWEISNITYMTFSENGVYTLSESKLIADASLANFITVNCSETIPRYTAFQESKVWCKKNVNTTRIAFIMDVSSFICNDFYANVNEEFVENQHLNIYFFIYHGAKTTWLDRFYCFKRNFMHIEDIKDITYLAEFYSTICADTNCPSQNLSYTSKNALHSFYHIKLDPQEISSEEARQYCSQIPNNYMLSLETMEELEFIFQYLHDTSLLTISSELHLHIGLRFACWFFFNWSSGFPFVLHHFVKTEIKGCLFHGDKWYPEYCFVLTPEKYDQHYELFVINKCHGPIDVISSCKNLVGDVFKRFVIWIVGLVTIVGNGIVLAYRLVWNREIFKKAYGLYVTGLAFSDFLMGIYLMMISSADIYYQDVYVLEETRWRNGMLCQISGFLSTLSSETSTFFICLITLDRFLTITFPFGEYRLPKLLTRVLFTLAWLFGIILAAIPLIISDWEIYSSNSLCLALPFSSNHFRGWEFSFIVYVGVNFVLFIVIAVGQVAIFVNIYRRKQSMSFLKNCRKRRLEDLAVAQKLAFVAMSDFLCWFPIGVIGYFSMKGHTFDRDVYAWFAVFVLPINSALNPIIYTIPALYVKFKTNFE
ncbi:G-protein coupled receptor GRL101, partial [Biomphalaria pfeifferi]